MKENDELDDSFGLKDGWWYYIKSLFLNPHTIFTRRKHAKEVDEKDLF